MGICTCEIYVCDPCNKCKRIMPYNTRHYYHTTGAEFLENQKMPTEDFVHLSKRSRDATSLFLFAVSIVIVYFPMIFTK